MALINHDDLINQMSEEDTQNGMLPDTVPQEPQQQEGYLKQLTGNIIYSNPVASRLYLGAEDKEISDPSYDRFSQLKGTQWEPLMSHFIYADNDEEMTNTKYRLSQEMELTNTVMNSGWVGTVGMFTGGLADPTLMVPVLGAVNKVKTAAQIGKLALSGVTGAATGMALSETALHQSQELRTPEQSAINVASAAVLGGVLGTAIGGVVAGKYKIANSIVNEILRTGEAPKMPSGSISAAEYTPSDASIAGIPGWMAKAMTMPGLRAPIIEGLTSRSPILKDVASRLFENNLIKERNRVGIKTDKEVFKEIEAQGYKPDHIEGTNVITKEGEKIPFNRNRAAIEEPLNMETKLKQDYSDTMKYRQDMEGLYGEYLKTNVKGISGGERAYFSAKKQGKMTAAEFYDEVGKWSRRTEKSGNQFVDRGVEIYRGMLKLQNNKMKALAEEGNVFEQFLDELEMKNRQSYFTIVPDRNKIINNRLELENSIADYYVSTKGIDKVEARQLASEHLDHFIGLDGAGTLDDIAKKFVSIDKGVRFTKSRDWDIPDTLLEAGLNNNAMDIGLQYIENSNKLARFQEFLNEMGETNIAGVRNRLKSEYDTQVAKISKAKDYNKLKAQAEADFIKDRALMDDFFAMALGQFNRRSPADRALRLLRTYNYVRLMGYIVLSSVTDLAMPIFKHGFGRTVMDGYVGGAKSVLSGYRKMQINDLKDIYAALDIEASNTLKTILDPEFTRSAGNTGDMFNAAGDWASSKFGKVSGIDYWNVIHKRMGARMAMSRIVRDIKNYANISETEKTYLNSLGIGRNNIKSILDQIDNHASDYNGAYITNIHEWTNKTAKEAFRGAIIKEIDSTIVTPSRGDIARLQQKSEIARTLLQFKGFFSAMSTKVIINGLQRRDANVLQGIISLLTLGAAQYNLRMVMQGKTPDNSPENLLVESMNRSGILGLAGDPIFGLILRPYVTGSRYMQQSAVEYPLGPSASLIKDLSKVYSDTLRLNFDDKTAKAMGHLIPFQNLFYLRLLIDKYFGNEESKK